MSEGSERIKAYFKRVGNAPYHELHSLPHHERSGVVTLHLEYDPTEVSEGWEKAFGQAIDKMVWAVAERQEQSAARLDTLEEEVKALKRHLVEGSPSITAPIQTFAPDPYELRQELKALILPDGDSFVATLVDANINASGETVQEAVANLKDTMIDLLEMLGKMPKEKLGSRPARQLAYLRSVMRRSRRRVPHH